MSAKPHRLEIFLDYIGDRLEVRHLIGAPFAILTLACLYFNKWTDWRLITFLLGFFYPFFCPRKWLWFGFFGWATFCAYLTMQTWKEPVTTNLVLGGGSVGLLIAAGLSYRNENGDGTRQ